MRTNTKFLDGSNKPKFAFQSSILSFCLKALKSPFELTGGRVSSVDLQFDILFIIHVERLELG